MTLRANDTLRPVSSRAANEPSGRPLAADVRVEDVRLLGRASAGAPSAGPVARAVDGAWSGSVAQRAATVVVPDAVATAGVVDSRVRAELAAIAAAPMAKGVGLASSHDVVAPRAWRAPSGQGYGDMPGASRTRERVQLEMAINSRQLASLRDMFRAAASDEAVRADCPHVACAGDDANAVGVAVVVDVLTLCPGVFEAPEMAPYVDGACQSPSGAAAPFDLASLFAPIAQSAGMGLQALGGLLSNPVVVGILTPLLTAALATAFPGVGAVLAPLLPFVLPLVGQLLSGAGSSLAGSGGAGPFDALGVAGGLAAA